MKFVKFLSLILALLLVGGALVACGGGTETEAPETEGDVEGNVDREPINVNIIVRASEKGENVYESGHNGYDFEGETPIVVAILEEFMDFEYSIVVEYDDSGKLVKVGDLEASSNQFWLWSLAKAPKGAAQATPMEENIDEYSDITDGDTIILYLS